jgi:hypothetical protein
MTPIIVNAKSEGDHGYIGLYRGRQYHVWTSKGTYDAQCLIAAKAKAKKTYDITVMVAERPDGSPVVHSTASL